MTARAADTPATVTATTVRRMGFTFSADGGYGACLAETGPRDGASDGAWFPERWTLGGPEPYTVPLPGREPEEPGSELLPLPDGRVLICRRGDEGYRLTLLYPAGPDTAELPLGTLDLDEVTLLPLPVTGPRPTAAWHAGPALALALGTRRESTSGKREEAEGQQDEEQEEEDGAEAEEGAEEGTEAEGGAGAGAGAGTDRGDGFTTSVWLVSSGTAGPDRSPEPERIAEFPGRHVGGIWLDRAGRLLALDEVARGRTKTVVLDLDSGRPTPLLQIAPESNDRLLLADPDSGLLVVCSDAPGSDRLGWGVLGSERPFRFPECLRVPDAVVTPFAVQPGAALTPEDCGVAMRVDGSGAPGDSGGSRLAVWRPAHGGLCELAAPEGWLVGSGHWSVDGLRLPYANGDCPFGVATVAAEAAPGAAAAERARPARPAEPIKPIEPSEPVPAADGAEAQPQAVRQDSKVAPPAGPPRRTPVPLQQAPLAAVGA